jgi:carbon monoxide dehydrogenase subunit G
MPSAIHRHSAPAGQPIDAVWARLQEAGTWAGIGPVEEVWDPVHEGGRLRSYRWRTTVGPTRYDGTATVVRSEPPHRMELSLDGGEVTGTLTTELSTNGDRHTTITVSLKIVSRGMLSSMFFPVVSDAVRRGLPEQVDRFARSLES